MNKEILRLAIPNIISNISVPLLSAVDTALMGHLSTMHLGAVGLGAMIFNFLYWNFGFLRMGTTGLVAQSLGGNDQERIVSLLWQSVVIGLGVGLLLLLGRGPLLSLAYAALDIGSEQQPLVADYYSIVIIGAPIVIATYGLYGWLFGMQDALTPMVVTIITNVVNISVSYHLVIHRELGIAGAAMGTLISQVLAFLILFVVALIRTKGRSWRLRSSSWSSFLTVNRDLFLRTVALTFAFGFFYRQSSDLGPVVLAAHVILLQFLSWMSYGIDGFAFASESLVGLHYGARDFQMVDVAVKRSFQWGLGLALFFGLLFLGLGNEVAELYTDDPEVLATIRKYMWSLSALPLLAFGCYIWDGIFIGYGASREMRDAMLLSLICYVVLFTIFREFTTWAIWISFMIFLALRGVLQTVYYARSIQPRLWE